MSLPQELKEYRAKFNLKASNDKKLAYQNGIDAIRKSGLAENALGVGQLAVDFSLINAADKQINLYQNLNLGPVILTWYRGGWWGPVGYRGYRYGYHRGWHHGYRAGARAGYRAGYRAGQRRNIYNRPQNRARNVPRASTQPQNRARATPQTRPNNVYSDRSGNVYRRNDNGNWQQRGGNGWQPSTGGANRSQLDRSAQTRQRGATRSNNYQRSGGGASRGGRRR